MKVELQQPCVSRNVYMMRLVKYGSDGKKEFEIHTVDHKGLGTHYHTWKDGRPGEAAPLADKHKKLLNDIKSLI